MILQGMPSNCVLAPVLAPGSSLAVFVAVGHPLGHDAPVTDIGAENLLAKQGLAGELFDFAFHEKTIQHVADALRGCIRSGDEVVRQGGDEFAVIATNLKSPFDAEHLARRIVENLAMPFSLSALCPAAKTSVRRCTPFWKTANLFTKASKLIHS